MSTLNSRSYINLRDVVLLNDTSALFFVIYDQAKEIACASIETILPRKVIARFEDDHLNGLVMFSQESPIDPTLVDIELKTNLYAYSYGIDELPTITRSSEEPMKCANINNIIYNPGNISPFSVPIEGLGTSDQYAIGDLSGKYGTLLKKYNEKISTVDFNLPLFGRNSIVGRALVFYAPNGTTVACTNLDLSEAEMTIAFATFDKPVQGQIILKQRKQNCTEDTYVYFEISKSQENATTSKNHEWSIRKNPIFTGKHLIWNIIINFTQIYTNYFYNLNIIKFNNFVYYLLLDNSWSTTDCVQTDQIFNPYNKSTDAIYGRDCNYANVIACKLGDMAKKLSLIDIVPYKLSDSGTINLKKYYFVDSFLPLCGPNSVIGKSVQINQQNQSSQALTCANLVLLESEDQDYN